MCIVYEHKSKFCTSSVYFPFCKRTIHIDLILYIRIFFFLLWLFFFFYTQTQRKRTKKNRKKKKKKTRIHIYMQNILQVSELIVVRKGIIKTINVCIYIFKTYVLWFITLKKGLFVKLSMNEVT